MKKFIIKAILFMVVFITIDRVAFFFLQSQRPKDYKLFLDSKLEFFEKDHQTDILIIGDSHIADALDPRILEKCSEEKVFNLGIYHASPYENYFVLKAALHQLKENPSTVILGTNPVMFEKAAKKGTYTPLILGTNFELILNSAEGPTSDDIFKVLREKHLIKQVYNKIIGYEYQPTRKIKSVYNGHLEFYNQIEDINWGQSNTTSQVLKTNDVQIDYFIKTIDLIISYNIDLIIVNPPIWSRKSITGSNKENLNAFEYEISRIAKENEIAIYNPRHNLLIDKLEKQDFLNPEHLNYNGSKKFTKGFCTFFLNRNSEEKGNRKFTP